MLLKYDHIIFVRSQFCFKQLEYIYGSKRLFMCATHNIRISGFDYSLKLENISFYSERLLEDKVVGIG